MYWYVFIEEFPNTYMKNFVSLDEQYLKAIDIETHPCIGMNGLVRKL